MYFLLLLLFIKRAWRWKLKPNRSDSSLFKEKLIHPLSPPWQNVCFCNLQQSEYGGAPVDLSSSDPRWFIFACLRFAPVCQNTPENPICRSQNVLPRRERRRLILLMEGAKAAASLPPTRQRRSLATATASPAPSFTYVGRSFELPVVNFIYKPEADRL